MSGSRPLPPDDLVIVYCSQIHHLVLIPERLRELDPYFRAGRKKGGKSFNYPRNNLGSQPGFQASLEVQRISSRIPKPQAKAKPK
jgi:hypothetical protein